MQDPELYRHILGWKSRIMLSWISAAVVSIGSLIQHFRKWIRKAKESRKRLADFVTRKTS